MSAMLLARLELLLYISSYEVQRWARFVIFPMIEDPWQSHVRGIVEVAFLLTY